LVRLSTSRIKHFLAGLLLMMVSFTPSMAQDYTREVETGEKVSLTVKSKNGRVSVITSDEQKKNAFIEARTASGTIDATDVKAESKGNNLTIEVKDRPDKSRIDLIVRLPARSKVKIESEAGAVDVVGNFESA